MLLGQIPFSVVHSRTFVGFFSAIVIIFFKERLAGFFTRRKPPRAPLKDFSIPFFASDCRIFAKKLFDIPSSDDRVSTSI